MAHPAGHEPWGERQKDGPEAGDVLAKAGVSYLRQFHLVSTLAEIESAAAALSAPEKAELLLFVAGQSRAEGAPLPEPRLFSPEQLSAWMDEDEADMRKFRAGE
jgi:hypothetical protein